MSAPVLNGTLGATILDLFKNEDNAVKVFETIFKYVVTSQKFRLTKEQIHFEKVSIFVQKWSFRYR